MGYDGRPWLPGGDEGEGQREQGRIYSQQGRWYWLAMAHPLKRLPAIPGATDPDRAEWQANASEIMALGVELLADHPLMPSLEEIGTWQERIEDVWEPLPPGNEGEWPPGVDPWFDLPLLDARYPERLIDGMPEFEEQQGTRQYSNAGIKRHGFPSPRDYNRAIEEYLLLVSFRYKLAMQVLRMIYFGRSGGRPRNE